MTVSRLFPLAFALAGAWLALSGADTAAAQEDPCKDSGWTELRDQFYERSGCVSTGKESARFRAIAFDPTTYELGLRGSRSDGKLPSLDDVNAAEAAGKLADYSLNQSLRDGDLAAANVGYPEDERFFVASGLVRIDGTDLAHRDTQASFKSAMLCLNEAEYNQIGSRMIIFNAFERNRPIQLNDRLRETNCLDVVQVGPRIVEYRAKKGIAASEARSSGQRYAVFAQGNGGTKKATGFLAYLFVFETPINLYNLQEFLLSPDAGQIDTKMRVAVVLATDKYSGLVWRSASGEPMRAGATTRPHPLFLTVGPAGAAQPAEPSEGVATSEGAPPTEAQPAEAAPAAEAAQ